MGKRLLLTSVSAAQLVSAVGGMVLALRRGHSFDVPFMHGRSDRIMRESLLQGTAMSAPVTMLVAQAAVTLLLARRPSRTAVRAIGILGAVNVPGFLSERLVRRRLSASGWDPLESSVVIVEVSLAAAMALLAWRDER